MIKPFWKIEDDFHEDYMNYLYDCEHAYNLRDALACGSSMTYLNGKQVGYLKEDGGFALYDEFKDKTDKQLEDIKVMFDRFVRDEDGYSDAYFNEVKEIA